MNSDSQEQTVEQIPVCRDKGYGKFEIAEVV